MIHLLATFCFAGLLLAAGALIVRMIQADAEKIARALLRMAPAEAKPWSSRVRMVSMRPSATRSVPPRRAAA